MAKRGDRELLSDVQEAIGRIHAYTNALSYEKFRKDLKTQDAVVRNLAILGEAVKGLSADFKRKHKNIKWKDIAGMRDRLVHDYFGVNWEIVWDVVKTKLPELDAQLARLARTRR